MRLIEVPFTDGDGVEQTYYVNPEHIVCLEPNLVRPVTSNKMQRIGYYLYVSTSVRVRLTDEQAQQVIDKLNFCKRREL